jgi:hypothetical protein
LRYDAGAMNVRRKRILRTLALLASLTVAVASAASMVGKLRAVDVVALFAGGFGAGVAAAGFLRELWSRRQGKPGDR